MWLWGAAPWGFGGQWQIHFTGSGRSSGENVDLEKMRHDMYTPTIASAECTGSIALPQSSKHQYAALPDRGGTPVIPIAHHPAWLLHLPCLACRPGSSYVHHDVHCLINAQVNLMYVLIVRACCGGGRGPRADGGLPRTHLHSYHLRD